MGEGVGGEGVGDSRRSRFCGHLNVVLNFRLCPTGAQGEDATVQYKLDHLRVTVHWKNLGCVAITKNLSSPSLNPPATHRYYG